MIGRIGGDEFLIYMTGISDMAKAVERFAALNESVSLFCSNHFEENFKISLSGGIVMIYGTHEFYELYHYADMALYCAKKNGKNQYYIYNYYKNEMK
ncbi:diguanylate cyclase [Aminipila terrae]|uniref:Diguanylate cyclase n=1 Tax=Aminipila terrae TaxID=2697030 RepID=A0A6P1MQQ7_9FIRM|nr:diguanylate cyclase [Aminipila terrae]